MDIIAKLHEICIDCIKTSEICLSINVFNKPIFSQEHIEIIAGKDGELLFFKQRDAPWYPTLRLLHKCKF